MKLDQRGSAILGEEACRDHLARVEATASGVGRRRRSTVLNGDQSPYVIPVNFTVVDGGILDTSGARLGRVSPGRISGDLRG